MFAALSSSASDLSHLVHPKAGPRFVIHRYLELKKMAPGQRQSCQKRVVLIGGKEGEGFGGPQRLMVDISDTRSLMGESM